jgi:hypothetical protein
MRTGETEKTPHPYADIMDKERPVLPKHPPMPRASRAKQFMPFASLRGFEREIANQRRDHVSETVVYEMETYDPEEGYVE